MVMKYVILITFFLILQRKVDCTIENDKIKAVAALSEQLVNGISDYISECNLVPVGKICQTIGYFERNLHVQSSFVMLLAFIIIIIIIT